MQSVDRLIKVLEVVGLRSDPVSAVEVANATGLTLATASRLMIAFADAGLLHRSESDRRYTLGARLYSLARAAETHLDLPTIAATYLEEVRNRTGETTSLHVSRGSERICIAAASSRHPLRRVVHVGLEEPIAGSATGAILMRDRKLDDLRLVAKDLLPAEYEKFEATMRHARNEGWALVIDDYSEDLCSVSAAVSVRGRTLAALSVSGPSSRFTREVALSHVGFITEITRALEQRIGG